jgi:hypothetical protein
VPSAVEFLRYQHIGLDNQFVGVNLAAPKLPPAPAALRDPLVRSPRTLE